MKIRVETPKWSFKKMKRHGNEYKMDFFSPIPTPFNYGYIDGTCGDDGQPLDVIILGKSLKSGEFIDIDLIGKVSFIDDGRRDDKYIASSGKQQHELKIYLFFKFYQFTKLLLGLLMYRRWTKNRFQGITWFEKKIPSLEELERVV